MIKEKQLGSLLPVKNNIKQKICSHFTDENAKQRHVTQEHTEGAFSQKNLQFRLHSCVGHPKKHKESSFMQVKIEVGVTPCKLVNLQTD